MQKVGIGTEVLVPGGVLGAALGLLPGLPLASGGNPGNTERREQEFSEFFLEGKKQTADAISAASL